MFRVQCDTLLAFSEPTSTEWSLQQGPSLTIMCRGKGYKILRGYVARAAAPGAPPRAPRGAGRRGGGDLLASSNLRERRSARGAATVQYLP